MNVQEAIDALPTTVEGLVEYLTLNGYTGIPEDPEHCPLANYFKMVTGNSHLYVTDYRVSDESGWYEVLQNWDNVSPLPEVAQVDYDATEAMNTFIVAFDGGAYPDLVVDDA